MHRDPPALGTALLVAVVLGLSGCATPPEVSTPAPTASSVPTATTAPTPPALPSVGPTPTPAAPSSAPAQTSTPPVLPASVVATNTTPRPVKAIATGDGICVIREDETLVCWGAGRLAPTGRFSALGMGPGTCAIRVSGKLECWGFEGSRLPVPRGTFTAVAAGAPGDWAVFGAKCAVRTDGTLACWNDLTDEGGPARTAEPVAVPDGTFTTVTSVPDGWCALRTDSTLACWGWGWYGPAAHTSPSGTYRSLSGPCAVRTSGELECGDSVEWVGAGPPDAGSYVAVSVYLDLDARACALRTDGTLACWGAGGHDEVTDEALPMRTPSGTFTAVSVGSSVACATRPDGRAVCWSDDDDWAPFAPVVRLDVPEWVASRRIVVRWAGMPGPLTPSARIVSYDVERFSGYDAEWNPEEVTSWLEGTTRRSATVRAAPGKTHCWRARAHAADGSVSAWSHACTTLPDDDAVFTRSGGWTTARASWYFAGRASVATRRGAALSLDEVYAYSLGIIATTCPSCGTIEVSYEGSTDYDEDTSGTERVSLRSSRTVNRALVFLTDNGQMGVSGTVTIKVVSKGKPVIIDGILFDVCPGCE